jgi:molybdate transport system ATP-binding protein
VLAAEASTQLGTVALDVSIAVEPGRCLALAGPSGAGKTSLLRIVAGLVRPDRGRVTCDGAVWLDTAKGVALAPDERRCGYVFQEYALFPTMRAWENVAYPMRGVPRRARRARACELLERFGVGSLADAAPRVLSGGERQRVALARALARRPEALLLDEPLSALDARTRAASARVLASVLAELEVPALLVTHDFAEAAELGDRVGIVDAGRIVQQGSASELAAAPANAFVADFTGAIVLSGVARPGAEGLTVIALDGGGEVLSTDVTEAGPVAVTVYPWDIAIEPPGPASPGSAQNRLDAEVSTITIVGNRARLGLSRAQPLAAEITLASVHRLGLQRGARVAATWKAAATRLVPR